MSELLEKFKSVVGPGGWTTDPGDLDPYVTEWRGQWRGRPLVLLRPGTVEQVQDIVRACVRDRVALVPQGGNTGLCGAAIPDRSGSQVLVSLKRLNRIRDIDPADYSMTAEAGCILADLQAAAVDAGRYFPLSLAAEGSCQIGGNLSTNAGGTNVLRYGTARDQVLGLEVVLPDGSLWSGLRRLRKDTAGYDLKQLFVGAEGTLGIITAATLKLYPQPANRQVAFLALPSAEAAVDAFALLRGAFADQLQAFELIPSIALQMVARHLPDQRQPMDNGHPWYVLLDTAQPDGTPPVEQRLAPLFESGLAVDGVVAKNESERATFWAVRHAISEAQKREGASMKHDISVPVGEVARFIAAATKAVEERVAGARVVAFGHVGDGNVHFNVSQPVDADADDFLGHRSLVADAVYDVVRRFGGSISAEHGIGVLKRDALRKYRDPVEIRLMETLKSALDPAGLFNPGKVL